MLVVKPLTDGRGSDQETPPNRLRNLMDPTNELIQIRILARATPFQRAANHWLAEIADGLFDASETTHEHQTVLAAGTPA